MKRFIFPAAVALSVALATPALAGISPASTQETARALPAQAVQASSQLAQRRDRDRDRDRSRARQPRDRSGTVRSRSGRRDRVRTQQDRRDRVRTRQDRRDRMRTQRTRRDRARANRAARRYDWNRYQRGRVPPQWRRHRRNFNARHWQRNYRAHRRYRWDHYRRPHGWYYRRWVFGSILPFAFWTRDYWIDSYWNFGLIDPPYGYVWVRYGPDAILVNVHSGVILRVVYSVFY